MRATATDAQFAAVQSPVEVHGPYAMTDRVVLERERQQPQFIQRYVDALHRCYPHKDIRVKPVRPRRGEPFKYSVIIDHNSGDLLLSDQDLSFAVRMLSRGIH